MAVKLPISADSLRFLEIVAELSYCNPFTARRVERERDALGSEFLEDEQEWNLAVAKSKPLKNVELIISRAEREITPLREMLADQQASTDVLRYSELYKDVVFFILYHRYRAELIELIEAELVGRGRAIHTLYDTFERDTALFFRGIILPATDDERDTMRSPAHLFALAYQIARAFFHIYQYMIGVSAPMQLLRARVWESIFTCDLKQYNRILFAHLGEVTTLITGLSGTGKELIARAVGLSRYLPFDQKKKAFTQNFSLSFFPIQLSAYPATLIESELFGHTRGAFTGAVRDRKGWLEECGGAGTVFLDEIGEIEQSIQVKLLRVLERREFYRLGDNKRLAFPGKLIAATNRKLEEEIERGAFRADLYYRLCADQIETPSLAERLRESPQELDILVRFILSRILPSGESETVAARSVAWIRAHLPAEYPWPGNVRELEQCVRNILIHGEYVPHQQRSIGPLDLQLQQKIAALSLTADELVSWYCAFAYEKLQNYEETGRRLGIDRRTVKSKVGSTS